MMNPTPAEVQAYKSRVYLQAVKGSQVNPGLPVRLAELVAAQAEHETGGFTSNAFEDGFNAFGYDYVPGAKRYQLAIAGRIADNGQPLAVYRNIEDSTQEMVDWIYRRRKEGIFPADLSTITTPAQYAALLKAGGYYGDTVSNYTAGITRYFQQATDFVKHHTAGVAVVAAVLALAGIYYFYKKPFRNA